MNNTTSNVYHPNRRFFNNNQYPHPYNNIPNPNHNTANVRLLVHVMVAGGVIGRKGAIVRNMESQIGVKIILAGTVFGCVERVVTVSGSDVLSKTVKLEDEVFQVSPVQEAVLRVFERSMEVDAENGDVKEVDLSCCCCRVLADKMECAILIGKGGKSVAKICRETQANVRVLRPEQNPAFAAPDDRIIHITGKLLPVKKALLAVTKVLQGLWHMEKEPLLMSTPRMVNVPIMMNDAPVVTVHRKELPDPHSEFFPDLCVPIKDLKGVKSVGLVDRTCSVDLGDVQCDVIFRMVCSNSEAGAIIGNGAIVLRLLQNESGAFIKFAPPVDGVEYRIVTISAKEGLSSSYSPAQNAVVRIVAKVAEIAAKESCGSSAETITVRLLITPSQADSFRGEDSILSEIEDVDIQILEEDLKLSSHLTDQILQIKGEYKDVQNALLLTTKKLREGFFPSSVFNGAGETNHVSCAIPDIDTYKRTKDANLPHVKRSLYNFPIFNQENIKRGMNRLRISDRLNEHFPGQTKDIGKSCISSDDTESMSSSDNKVTLVVKVPDHAFDSVFGENGSNINHIKQISAADLEVQDPAPDQIECTIMVSGEPNQVLAASTLLQAYIQAASLSSSA